MNDRDIIKGLIERDNEITKVFFYDKCRPLFCKIINFVFSYEVDYDEFVNELYVYLMDNDAQKLRNFEYRSSVYMWLKILAIRYFIKKRGRMIDNNSQSPPYDEQELINDEATEEVTKGDLERLFKQMPTQRYAYVIRMLLIEEIEPIKLAEEMGITIENLYNIKHRAMAQLTRVALNDIKEYGKKTYNR